MQKMYVNSSNCGGSAQSSVIFILNALMSNVVLVNKLFAQVRLLSKDLLPTLALVLQLNFLNY